MPKRFLFFLSAIFVLLSFHAEAQNISYTRKCIKKLASKSFYGRGYGKNGDKIAANFIVSQLQSFHLSPINKNYNQTFLLNSNTFTKQMCVKVDGSKLRPGVDFIPLSYTTTTSGKFPLLHFKDINNLKSLNLQQTYFLVNDTTGFTEDNKQKYYSIIKNTPIRLSGVINLRDKLTYSPAPEAWDICEINILQSSFNKSASNIYVDIQNELKTNYETQNIVAILPGESDSIIALSAHYDHLGMLGKKNYFPGASDNASGVSFLLDLARHYSQQENRKYTLCFLFFSGEELGLLGSSYFCEHPLFDLSRIKLLCNFDILSSGDEGIMVVNGTEIPKAFHLLQQINSEKQLLEKVGIRGKAANSDHFPFTEKGVPACFVYSIGNYKKYHDIRDKAKKLPLNAYENIFILFREFIDQL